MQKTVVKKEEDLAEAGVEGQEESQGKDCWIEWKWAMREERQPERSFVLWVNIVIHSGNWDKGYGIMEERSEWSFGEQMRILVRGT